MERREHAAYADGASRGNPGHAGLGVAICNPEGNIIKEFNEYLGECTSPVAEYKALICALKNASGMGIKNLKVFSDSELIVKQFNGEYRTQDENLKKLLQEARNHEKSFDKLEVIHIRRSSHEHNKRADKLANIAINRHTV